jgi:hypothetical protein
LDKIWYFWEKSIWGEAKTIRNNPFQYMNGNSKLCRLS